MVPDLTLAAVLHKAVKKAAYSALKARQAGLIVEVKPDGSKVTNGDCLSQITLFTELWAARERGEIPSYVRFIAEEACDEEMLSELPPGMREYILTLEEWRASGRKGDVLMVDPVDGTEGYSNTDSHRINPWGVNCAYIRDGKTIACAMYESSRDECAGITPGYIDRFKWEPTVLRGSFYIAEQGRGAFRFESGLLRKLGRIDLRGVKPFFLGRYPGDEKIKPGLLNIQFAPEERTGKERQPGRQAVIELVDGNGPMVVHALLSAVAAIGEVASGRAAGCSGAGYPWDHYGGDLLLAEIGIPVVVRQVKNSERTVIIAAHDPAVVRDIDNELVHQGEVEDFALRRENVPNVPNVPKRRSMFAAYPSIK